MEKIAAKWLFFTIFEETEILNYLCFFKVPTSALTSASDHACVTLIIAHLAHLLEIVLS